MRAIQIAEFGGPEQLELVEVPEPQPAAGTVVVDVARAGINFADTHATQNDYLAKQTLPLTPGMEIAGTTAEGKRVAAMLINGGYAEKAVVPEDWLVPVPDGVGDETAAALLVQGLTAHALLHRCGHLQQGESVVVEAAAGGTGGLAVQLAKRAGARVIALASSEEKRELALQLGADAAVDSRAAEMGEAILDANGGKPVDIVLQMSGGDAFEQQLRVLAPFGRMVSFGIASQEENRVRTGHLMRNSRSVIGFWLMHLLADRDNLAEMLSDLFGAVEAGDLEVPVSRTYRLEEAPLAHAALRDRTTTGKLLLDPTA